MLEGKEEGRSSGETLEVKHDPKEETQENSLGKKGKHTEVPKEY